MTTPTLQAANAIEVAGVSKSYRLWHDSMGPINYGLASALNGLVGRSPRTEKYFRWSGYPNWTT